MRNTINSRNSAALRRDAESAFEDSPAGRVLRELEATHGVPWSRVAPLLNRQLFVEQGEASRLHELVQLRKRYAHIAEYAESLIFERDREVARTTRILKGFDQAIAQVRRSVGPTRSGRRRNPAWNSDAWNQTLRELAESESPGGQIERWPAVGEIIAAMYDILSKHINPMRRQGLGTRAVKYNTRAIRYTVELLNSSYGSQFSRFLTRHDIVSRLQKRL